MTIGGPVAGGGRDGPVTDRVPIGSMGWTILILLVVLALLLAYLLVSGQPLQ